MSRSDHGHAQLALLERLLGGSVPTEAELDELLRQRLEEDLHLDYKGPEIREKDRNSPETGKPNDFNGKLRKHIAGFANGDGGVLVVGVSEVDRNIRPPPQRVIAGLSWSPEDARQQARDALQPLAASGQIRPRIEALKASTGTVLFIAVPRADGVVYCTELQRPVFYIRLHDSTVHAPAYLVEDLVLGRRRRPTFRVGVRGTGHPERRDGDTIQLAFTVENTSMVWADDTRLALFGYRQLAGLEAHTPLAQSVREHLRDQGGGARDVVEQLIPIADGTLGALPPFTVVALTSTILLSQASTLNLWGGVLVVLPRDQAPTWFQIVLWDDRRDQFFQASAIPLGDRRGFVGYHRRDPFFTPWQPPVRWGAMDNQGGSMVFTLKEPEADG